MAFGGLRAFNGGTVRKRMERRRKAGWASGCVCVKVAEVAAAGWRHQNQTNPKANCPQLPSCPAGRDTRSGRSGKPAETFRQRSKHSKHPEI